MSNIKIGSDNRQSGKTVYNANIIHDIVALAVVEVEGVIPQDGKKKGIALYVEKDGVYADVSVIVKYGYPIPELAYRIQQSVKQSVENMTRYRVAQVDVHVQDVVFAESAPIEKEPEEEIEEEQNSSEKKEN